jgi:hypothetical protein
VTQAEKDKVAGAATRRHMTNQQNTDNILKHIFNGIQHGYDCLEVPQAVCPIY